MRNDTDEKPARDGKSPSVGGVAPGALGGVSSHLPPEPSDESPLPVSRAILRHEIAFVMAKAEKAQADLTAALGREARFIERNRELETAVAERALTEDSFILADKLQKVERELDIYRSAKRSAELAVLDARSTWKDAEARLDKLRMSPAYRLGSLLIAGFLSWSEIVRLPALLIEWRREVKRVQDEAADELVPVGVAPEYLHASETAIAKADKDGAASAERWVQDQRFRAPILARVLLELAKHVRQSDPATAVALAKSAAEADPNEGRVKHFAFMLMDAGSIGDAYGTLQAAVAAGAVLNATEARRRDELLALERLQKHGVHLPKRVRRRHQNDANTLLLYAPQSLPYHWSGTSMRAHGFAQTAKALGFSVEVVTPPGYPASKAQDAAKKSGPDLVDGIPYHRIAAIDVAQTIIDEYAQASGFALGRVARALEASVIVAPSDLDVAYAASIAARISSAALALDCQKLMVGTADALNEQQALVRDLECALMKEADLVLARWNGAVKLLSHSGVASSRIVAVGETVPSFVADINPPNWRADPALSGRTVVGYIGDPLKDVDLEAIADIFDRLVAQGLDVGLVVFGVGSPFQKLRNKIEQLGHGMRALFPGRPRLGAIRRAYETIDIVLVPARTDGGRVARAHFELIDALTNGKAIVASGDEVVREILGDCAEIADEGLEPLAEAVARLVCNSDRRSALEAMARERSQQTLSADALARRFEPLGALLQAPSA